MILVQHFAGFLLIELPASCHGRERLNGFGSLQIHRPEPGPRARARADADTRGTDTERLLVVGLNCQHDWSRCQKFGHEYLEARDKCYRVAPARRNALRQM